MPRHVSRPPVQRLALINPTKFLGNLLLAGGLIQYLEDWCAQQGISLLLVVDDSFQDLLRGAFSHAQLVYYPRKALRGGEPRLRAARLWLKCVREIRAFRADLAFTIEEDSVSQQLTHFSGAKHKVSSTTERYEFGFDEVLDVSRTRRPAGRESIWYSFAEVLQRLDFPVPSRPAYMRLSLSGGEGGSGGERGSGEEGTAPDPAQERVAVLLKERGLSADQPYAVVHAGASKFYKQWPVTHFSELTEALLNSGLNVLLIGAGRRDREVNQGIISYLDKAARERLAAEQLPVCMDLCNELTLRELAWLIANARLMAGNDSGPSHLASSLGVRGVVIFGPTDIPIWRPLGRNTVVLDNKAVCDATCTRHDCAKDYLCLRSVTPQDVMKALFSGD